MKESSVFEKGSKKPKTIPRLKYRKSSTILGAMPSESKEESEVTDFFVF